MNSDPTHPFEIGDHLFVDCGGYSHHGIYVGDGELIHFDSTPARKILGDASGRPPRICRVSLIEFAGDKEVHRRDYSNSEKQNPELHNPELQSKDAAEFSVEQVIQRAESRLGEQGYNLFDNNCEHFAVWCKTGHSTSSQVESACRVAQTGVAGLAMGTAMVRAARYFPVPYRVLAYGAGAAIVLGSTTYRFIVERQQNRDNQQS